MARVRFLVRDVDRAVRAYTAGFGFELIEQHGQAFALVRRDDLDIGLSGPDSSACRSLEDGTVPEPGGWNRILIEVADLGQTAVDLQARGIVLRNGIVRGAGGAQVLANDGEGNVVEFFQAGD